MPQGRPPAQRLAGAALTRRRRRRRRRRVCVRVCSDVIDPSLESLWWLEDGNWECKLSKPGEAEETELRRITESVIHNP